MGRHQIPSLKPYFVLHTIRFLACTSKLVRFIWALVDSITLGCSSVEPHAVVVVALELVLPGAVVLAPAGLVRPVVAVHATVAALLEGDALTVRARELSRSAVSNLTCKN